MRRAGLGVRRKREQAPVGELSAVKGNGEGLLGLLASRAGSARKAVCGVAQSRQAPLAMRREGLGVRRKQEQAPVGSLSAVEGEGTGLLGWLACVEGGQ